MNDSLSDFENKLYSIKPFIQTQSPPSSDRKDQNNEHLDILGPDHPFKHQDSFAGNEKPFQLPIRRIVSDSNGYHQGQSNFKTITSIASTIDMLFSKIEKIKQQFSYALEKPQSQSQIKQQSYNYHFSSLQNIQFTSQNKENQFSIQTLSAHSQRQKDIQIPFSKYVGQTNSLPLQDHEQNNSNKSYYSHPEKNETSHLFSNFSPQISINSLQIRDFELGKCIGSGKFGDVYISKHKQTGFICAIKKIFKSTIKEYKMEQQFATQLKIHYSLNHCNIIKLYAHFQDEYHIFLLMEYACDGTLMNKLKSEEVEVSRAINQTLDAVQYMHRNRVVHRDIKPENIVCSFDLVKVCDFGWAAILQNNMKKTFCGTLDYVSPEMKDVGEYNQSVDLWSIGVLTFELLAGFPPFKHEISYWKLCGSQRKMKWNWQVIYPPQLSYFSQRFIDGLLKENPLERASIQQCRHNYFIQKYTTIKSELEQEFLILLM